MRPLALSLVLLFGCDSEAVLAELCEEAAENGCVLLDAEDASQAACTSAFDRARAQHDPGCRDAFDQWLECVEEEVDNAKVCLSPEQLDRECSGQLRALESCDETYAEQR